MKKFSNLSLLSLVLLLLITSCGTDAPENNKFKIKNPTQVRAGGAADNNSEAFTLELNFDGQMISLKTDDIIDVSKKTSAENQDAMDVMSINQNLMGAEKEAQLLDVNFTMSDEPVDNGMFIFGIETEDAKDLILEMRDEEGFALVANNKFEIIEGNNYKALNVSSLDNGIYNFRLKDETGKELNRQINIAKNTQ
ncbi:hypothetical protein [Aureispira anguillae]|uniref:Lipoprotein n=1 Tax=Aureispira anguillae TaxID=2864201 RepID=A0A915YB80_9BACT|nr:hypothetical protein [Aureispira anguillae]BDS09878.1 hypothetical protein AsAng_0005830 [Aureispira anguillae]